MLIYFFLFYFFKKIKDFWRKIVLENVDENVNEYEKFVMNKKNNDKMMLKVINLYKIYGDSCVIKNLTFCIKKNDSIGFLGNIII